jgi:hypothetical protein
MCTPHNTGDHECAREIFESSEDEPPCLDNFSKFSHRLKARIQNCNQSKIKIPEFPKFFS